MKRKIEPVGILVSIVAGLIAIWQFAFPDILKDRPVDQSTRTTVHNYPNAATVETSPPAEKNAATQKDKGRGEVRQPVRRPEADNANPNPGNNGGSNEKPDFVVMGTENGTYDGDFSKLVTDWLRKAGNGSPSIVQQRVLNKTDFEEVMGGNPALVTRVPAAQAAKYTCLAQSKIAYVRSTLEASLVVVKYTYEVVILESATGRQLDYFNLSDKTSGVSEEMAHSRAFQEFREYIASKNLNLNF